ncbi:unnamed protein product [Lepeophtheirus salmonis]|uniref:(salmon louse) hypothetical protein n=1 Tax=Lepeophtheirus salmonis TaxID=72036 RepID=A0A7R8CL03_LEPSM|nr:unnamed protein product [Lepeophtheirus salmonis]CAF2824658.1 unnamed protein product [Lepeophtheirus salmonis]
MNRSIQSEKCPQCENVFKLFTESSREWNKIPHREYLDCWRKSTRKNEKILSGVHKNNKQELEDSESQVSTVHTSGRHLLFNDSTWVKEQPPDQPKLQKYHSNRRGRYCHSIGESWISIRNNYMGRFFDATKDDEVPLALLAIIKDGKVKDSLPEALEGYKLMLESFYKVRAHQGVSTMIAHASSYVFWPGVTKDIEKTIATSQAKCSPVILLLFWLEYRFPSLSTLSRTSVPIKKPFSTLYEGPWLERKEKRTYARGPITMECIRVTEEGYKITGIQPNGDAYNTTITWNKEVKRPYQSLGQDYEFDAEVYKDNYSRNVMRFNAYSKKQMAL